MRNSLGPTIEGYLDYCLSLKKLAHGTIKDIRCTLNLFNNYITERAIEKEIWQLTISEFIQWVNYSRDEGRTPKHINKSLSHIRGLIDYTWHLEKIDRNVLTGYFLQDSNQRSVQTVLSIEEAKDLVNAFSVKTKLERRNRMIILLLYGCGLRTNELCSLSVGDIDEDRQELKVFGKGSKERVIPLMDGVFTELLAYLKDRRSTRGPLFKTLVKKKRIRITNVLEIVSEASSRTKIDKAITPKTFRHSFASHLADQGIDIAVIAKLMGHRTVKETSVYLHASESKMSSTILEISTSKKESK